MTFQILSLSGGGFLGLYTISIIEKIEEQLGQPIARSFDLIAGTSIGGIIALGLAAEVPAKTIREQFEENGAKIFSPRARQSGIKGYYDILRFLTKPKYSYKALRETIVSLLGKETTLGDLKHPVIIPTVNLTKGSPQFFKTPHHPSFKRDLYINALNVALATSAAPIYFPLARINNSLFADGGLYANAPDLAAMHEAEHFFDIASRDIRMLSIGTTTSSFSLAHAQGDKLGLINWAKDQKLIRVVMASQQMHTENIIKHKLDDNYLIIDYLQSAQQESHLALDVATPEAIKTILGVTDTSYQQYVGDKLLLEMLRHQAPNPVFYDSKA